MEIGEKIYNKDGDDIEASEGAKLYCAECDETYPMVDWQYGDFPADCPICDAHPHLICPEGHHIDLYDEPVPLVKAKI